MQNPIIGSTLNQFLTDISLGEIVMLAVSIASVVILIMWLFLCSGPLALVRRPERKNRVPIYVPFLQLVVWMLLASAAMEGIKRFGAEKPDWMLEFASYLANTGIQLVLAVVTLVLAWCCFERRLKGFGLDLRTLKSDIPASAVNFIAILPLVWLGILVVDFVGKMFDPAFEIGANEGLDALTENPQMAMRVLMLVFIIVVVPVFEEFLFRGLFQSVARSYMKSAWLGIIATSVLFALMHPAQHWLAIFVLSLGIGYSYERSGSLWRPILIHVFFNTTNVLAALLMGE